MSELSVKYIQGAIKQHCNLLEELIRDVCKQAAGEPVTDEDIYIYASFIKVTGVEGRHLFWLYTPVLRLYEPKIEYAWNPETLAMEAFIQQPYMILI